MTSEVHAPEPSLELLWLGYCRALESTDPMSSLNEAQWLGKYLDTALEKEDPRAEHPAKEVDSLLGEAFSRGVGRAVEARDNEFVERFLLRGRGWKCLMLLSRRFSMEDREVWWSNGLVDLLIILYHLCPTLPSAKNPDQDDKASVDSTLLPPASISFKEVTDLWAHVKSLYRARKKKKSRVKAPWYKRVTNRKGSAGSTGSDIPTGFPSPPLDGGHSNAQASNLHWLEQEADEQGEEDESQESEHRRSQQEPLLKPYPRNPLDFEYFEQGMNSADEAKYMIERKAKIAKSRLGLEQVPIVSHYSAEESYNAQTDGASLTPRECSRLILSLLASFCQYQVHWRNLKSANELSLKLVSFASDALRGVQADKDAASSSEAQAVQQALTKLLLLSLIEAQFDQEGMSMVQRNNVLSLCMASLESSVRYYERSKEKSRVDALVSAIDMAAAFVCTMESFYSFSNKLFGRRDTNALNAHLIEWFSQNNGYVNMERILSHCAKISLEANAHGAVLSFYGQLTRMLSSIGVCKVKLSEEGKWGKKTIEVHCKLYSKTLKSLHGMMKAELHSSEARDRVPNQNDANSLKLLSDVTRAVMESSSHCLNPDATWEHLLSAVKLSLDLAPGPALAKNLLDLVSTLLVHHSRSHAAASMTNLSASAGVRSDSSDSAFGASDRSVEKDKKRSLARNLYPHVKTYLDLLNCGDEETVMSTVGHLERVVLAVDEVLQMQIFCNVVVPFVEERSVERRLTGTDVRTLQSMLRISRTLIEASADVQAYFKQHKLLDTVLIFKSTEGVIEEAYAVVRVFLNAELKRILHSPVYQQLTATNASGGARSYDSSPSSELEHGLTDEEAFQPQLMKALSLTSVVKEFHRILVSRTAKVLDLKKTKLDQENLDLKLFEELVCVWETEAQFVRTFSEYRDYAQSKGVVRIVEELFDFLVEQLPLIPASEHRPKNHIIATVGYLLKILIDFQASRDRDPDSGDETNFNSSFSDQVHILDRSLTQLGEVALKLDCEPSLRRIMSVIIDCAMSETSAGGDTAPMVALNEDFKVKNSPDESDLCYADVSSNSDDEAKRRAPKKEEHVVTYSKALSFALEMSVKLVNSGHRHGVAIAEYTIHKMYKLSVSDVQSMSAMADNGLLSKIISSFETLTKAEGLKNETSRFIVELGKHRLTRQELRSMVALFKQDEFKHYPTLLRCLEELATFNASALLPAHYLQFPTPDSSDKSGSSALAFDLPPTSSFFMAQKKEFSFSFWIRPSRRELTFPVLRLEDQTMSLSVEMSSSSLVVEVTTTTKKTTKQMCSCATFTVQDDLTDGEWNHVAINCNTKSMDAYLSANAIVNGKYFKPLLIAAKVPQQMMTEAPRLSLHLGGTTEERVEGCSCCVSTVQVFHDHLLDAREALCLFLLGPDQTALVELRDGHFDVRMRELLIRFPQRKSELRSKTWNPIETTERLRLYQLAAFQAKHPNALLCYNRPAESTSFLGHLVAGGSGMKSTEKVPVTVTQKRPVEGLAASHRQLFSQTVLAEGGVASLLLLLARTVELGGCDDDLARAATIVFSTMSSSTEAWTNFIPEDCARLLERILEHESCRFGIATVAAIVNLCCTEPVIVVKEERWVFEESARSIVHNPICITLMLSIWRPLMEIRLALDDQRSLDCYTLLDVVLHAFHILLKTDHDFAAMNVAAFRQLNVAKTLVYRWLEEESFQANAGSSGHRSSASSNQSQIDIAQSIVNIFDALIGSPADMAMLRDVMSSILLLCDARMTFVVHSKSSFYFNILDQFPSRASSWLATSKSRLARRGDRRCMSMNEDYIMETVMGDKSEAPMNGSARSPSLDSTALQKTLQDIREKRKHRRVLTSTSLPATRNEKVVYGLLDKNRLNKELNAGVKEIEEIGNDIEHTEKSEETPVDVDKAVDDIDTDDSDFEDALEDPEELEDDAFASHNILERPGPWGEENKRDDNVAEGVGSLGATDVLIRGLLNTLNGAVQNLPDANLSEVFAEIVLPEHILVLCKHSDDLIRDGAAKLMWNFVKRSRKMENHKIEELQAYNLFANQLHGHPATDDIVNACLSLVHDRDYNFEEAPEISGPMTVWIRPSGIIPLLSIMPNTTGNIATAHLLITHVHELFAKVPGMLKHFRSHGLFESICKTLRAFACSTPQSTDVMGQDTRDIIFQDIYDFLRLISLRLVTTQGPENYSSLEELLYLMLYLSQRRDSSVDVIRIFRLAINVVVEECLADIQIRVETLDAPQGTQKRRPMDNLYGSLFPMDEVTDIMRHTMTPLDNASIYSSTTTSGLSVRAQGLHATDCGKVAGRSELAERFTRLVDFAIDFLTQSKALGDELMQESANEILAQYLINLMTTELKQKWETPRKKGLFSNHQRLRRRLLTVINFRLSPGFSLEKRLKIVKTVNNQFRNPNVLSYLFENSPLLSQTFVVYLGDIMVNHKESMSVDDIIGCKQFYDFIKNCGVIKNREGSDEGNSSEIKNELDTLSHNAERARVALYKRSEDVVKRSTERMSEAAEATSKQAMEVTKTSMTAQDGERKLFISEVKRNLVHKVNSLHLWQETIERHTHDRAIWHFADKFPKSWFLSDSEGTQRIRIKLERKDTGLAKRFYTEEHKHKGDLEQRTFPFQFLSKGPAGMSSVIIEQLSSDEAIKLMERATFVLPDQEIKGEVLISASALYFVESSEESSEDNRLLSFSWQMDTVREIHRRWFQLEDTAVEIFFSTATTRFFVFRNRKQRNGFIKKLVACHPRLSQLPHPDHVQELWQDGEITNFDYLMQLNKLAGRTFNDLMQYPVFPFILADYSSETLNLFDSSSFRNLRKPIAVQNPEKEARYINNYEVLAENNIGDEGKDKAPGSGPFHYGSHYSNSGIVLHFLLRVPPFTAMFIKFQDGNFDLPDRSFYSINNDWSLTNKDSSSDVKELIPDLFCLPELLTNFEGFNFGVKQDGQRVNDVALPKWARSPRLFIKVHRQALEADYVREHLNYWIDLVFGYKQSGKEAVASINVFHPATYYGFDLRKIENKVQREARAAMIKTYGQTPKQIFNSPHPEVTRNWGAKAKEEEVSKEPKVLEDVVGLRWGNYVGSPSQSAPSIMLRSFQSTKVASFVSLANNEVYGLPENSTLVVKYTQERNNALSLLRNQGLAGAALLTHGLHDCVIRAKVRKNASAVPFFTSSPRDSLTLVKVFPEAMFLWLAFESGSLRVLGYSFNAKELTLQALPDETVWLCGHEKKVTCLEFLPEFGLAVSGSEDSTAIVWDLKKLSYIRTLLHEGPLRLIATSKTSGDIATVCQPSNTTKSSSRLTVFSINGTLASSIVCEPEVTSLAFSTAPEGVSCNVVATGHANGMIRLWSSWDLSPVRDVPTVQGAAIVALAFNFSNQNLYAATAEKELVVFEKADVKGMGNQPKYKTI